MSEGLFAEAQRAAHARGLQSGYYGVCPICDTPALELVRIGEWLVVDPCAHPILHLPYLRGEYPLGPRKTTRKLD